MRLVLRCTSGLIALLLVGCVAPAGKVSARQRPAPDDRTVVLIVADGLRWQEIFTGADSTLMNSEHGGIWLDSAVLHKRYWRSSGGDRRAVLFPFLWQVVAKRGQIFGNQAKGSVAHVTNGMAFSYPGYNEMLTGAPDPRINSNQFGPNPNVTVLEWLNGTPEYRGRVAVFATWNTFKDIFNVERSHLPLHVGFDPPYEGTLTPQQQLLTELYRTTTRLDDEDNYDAFLQIPLLDFVKTSKARVLFVGYGETDNWAHQGRYDLVLESAREFDRDVEELWTTMQAMPEYRGRTTFIITTDHGRGSGLVDWREHGVDEKGSENVWIAVMGPDTPALGERGNVGVVTQAQIAATVAQLLGKDWRASSKNAAGDLPVLKN
ncbi:MAG: AP protein [Gemmatimonadota bacterium]|nr:AP protein [Gemmatimonadota bacterium]